MIFLHESWLYAMVLLPVFWLLLQLADRAADRRLRAVLGARVDRHIEHRHGYLRTWQRFLMIAGVFWLMMALARPQWGAREIEHTQRGVDMVIALDISNSMRAADVMPDRLGLAKAELGALLQDYDRGRVGLVLFAGQAFVQCPLTLDLGALSMFLRMADSDMISTQGTGLRSALATSASLLTDDSDLDRDRGGRVILLVTDGEDLEGEWEEAAAACRDQGIVVMALGIGSPDGELVPELAADGSLDGYMKDQEGNVVISRLDMSSLQRASAMTGGEALRLGNGGLDRGSLLARFDSLSERDLSTRRDSKYNDRFAWPLLMSLLTFWVASLLRPGLRRRHGRVLVLVLCCACLNAGPAAAEPFSPDGRAEMQAGLEHYRNGEWEQALSAFESARSLNPDDPRLSLAVGEVLNRLERFDEAEREFQRARVYTDDPDLQAESLYNSGTNHLAAGDPQKAIEALRESLALRPDQKDALENLEHAIRLMQQPPPQDQQQQQQDQQQQDQQQEDQQQQEQQDQQQQDQQQQDQQQQDQQQEDQQQQAQQQPDQGQEQPARPDASSDEQRMDEQRAMDILKGLDRDEEELQKSLQKRLRGKPIRSGKRW